jgi:ribosomal protein S30
MGKVHGSLARAGKVKSQVGHLEGIDSKGVETNDLVS